MKNFYILTGVFFIFCSCNHESKKDSTPGESYASFTEDGAWCWFSDPRAIYFEGKHRRTYSGWVDSSGSVVVAFYDHDKKNIEKKILYENLQYDDHNNPCLFIDNSGKLLVFFSMHAKTEPLYLARASNPEEISDWDPLEALHLNDTMTYPDASNTYTYANVCQLADEENKLYLFWRGTDFKPNFSSSANQGKIWEAGKIIVLPDRIYKDRRPYMKISSNNKDVIHFVFTDGHPRDELTNSVYYMKYRKENAYKASGEKIIKWSELPIKPEEADLVYDAKISNQKAWIWDIAENNEGDPVIVYSKFPDDSNHVYCYTVWDNNKWNHYDLINSGGWFPETPAGQIQPEPNYSGGIALDHNDPSIVYLSINKNGKFEIEKWTTANKGRNWKIEEITVNSANNNVRPFVIRNYSSQDSLKVLWMNVDKYLHYTNYKTSVKMSRK